MIDGALGTEPAQSGCKVLAYALNHDHQVAPLHRIAFLGLILFRYAEASRLKTLDVHDHPSVLGMDQLHQPAARA